MIAFRRGRDGMVRAKLSGAERQVLQRLADQLPSVLEGGRDDPAVARLLPDAYGEDADASREFRELTSRALLEQKTVDAGVVAASAAAGDIELDEAGVLAWLRGLTTLRLVIAARLDIHEEGDAGSGDPELAAVYDWLGYLQDSLVHAIDGGR